jgi:hypothetical protein
MAARLALLVACTAVSYPVGLALGQPWLLPALNTLPAYVAMVARLRAADLRGAIVTVLVWAAGLAVFGTLSFALWPSRVDAVVLNGPAYRDEIFAWICTGFGREGDVRQFLPQHALHLAGFALLSLATASALSILMGAVLMNYMAFYVASLARGGAPLPSVLLLGWQPWAIARIAAFCVLGAVLAEPLLSRLVGYRYAGLLAARRWLLLAAGGILADVLLKALLAPVWARWLRSVLCA